MKKGQLTNVYPSTVHSYGGIEITVSHDGEQVFIWRGKRGIERKVFFSGSVPYFHFNGCVYKFGDFLPVN